MNTKELQIALCSLGSGVPDGVMGANTKKATLIYADLRSVYNTELSISADLNRIYTQYAPTPEDIKCPCGVCSGYGKEVYKNSFREEKPHIEAYYKYEYPGVSAVTIWATIMIRALFPQYEFRYSSGYRCWENNRQHRRTSTNHMGKALDLRPDYEDSKRRKEIADEVRKFFLPYSIQTGWSKRNTLSFEPANIAPTWLHTDCRCFDRQYIEDTLVKL